MRFLLVLLVLLASCAPKQPRVIPSTTVTRDDRGYGFIKQDDGSYLVFVKTNKALPEVRHEIGCPCVEEISGTVYILRPARQK